MKKTKNMTNFEQVEQFHEVFSHPISKSPVSPDSSRQRLRLLLIIEEVKELVEAHCDSISKNAISDAAKHIQLALECIWEANDEDFYLDVVEAADALTDILYTVYGAGHEYGIPLDVCFKEVHDSNMSKLGEDGKPIYHPETGKVQKGPNYRAPDLVSILQRAAIKQVAESVKR